MASGRLHPHLASITIKFILWPGFQCRKITEGFDPTMDTFIWAPRSSDFRLLRSLRVQVSQSSLPAGCPHVQGQTWNTTGSEPHKRHAPSFTPDKPGQQASSWVNSACEADFLPLSSCHCIYKYCLLTFVEGRACPGALLHWKANHAGRSRIVSETLLQSQCHCLYRKGSPGFSDPVSC